MTPATAQIRANATVQFSATVSGSAVAVVPGKTGKSPAGQSDVAASKRVIWSVNGITGGNAIVGTINDKGLYQAPAAVPSANTIKIVATSVAKPLISGAAILTLLNPVPAVTSVSPKRILVGGFTLTVDGRGFANGAQVLFGGQALQTSIKSATKLVATGAANQSQVGNIEILVRNPDPGSASSQGTVSVQVAPQPVAAQPPAPVEPQVIPQGTSTVNTSKADVLVDASQTVSETGTDDLTAAKNIYASASAPESNGGLDDWDLISSEFTMKRMRNMNGLGDCALDATGNLTGCTRLNSDLGTIQSKNLTPHVVVGQWAPSSIGGDPRQWGATQWAQYDALAYAIVNWVVNGYGGAGFDEALFEVENELDTTQNPQDLWLTTTPNVPQGDPSRFTQYDTVYSHWAKAISAVAQQNPNKKVRIAAPATGFWTVYYGSGQLWHDQIIKKYAAQGIRLDVVSLHIYDSEINDLARYAQSIRNTLNSNGNSKAEIWVTEWGASDSGDSYFGAINASHQGAAWGIDFLLQALKGTVTGGSFLEVRDNQGTDTGGGNSKMFAATWNHVENGVEYPKPIANAFSMINRMAGTRKSVAVTTAKPDLRALACSDATSASLIVANYNYLFDYTNKNYSDLTNNQTVTVAFKNLAFSGSVTVDRYLIDAQTSNLNHWVGAGKTPPSIQATQLQKVESFSTTVTGGAVILPPRQLGQSAVSLWIVHQ